MSVSCAVLLDRDGTLIEDKHYLSEPSGVALLPGVGRRCRVWFRRDIAFLGVQPIRRGPGVFH